MRALIVIAVIFGVSITVATIVIGSRTYEGTVVQDAYTEGLRWDEVRRARRESGWSVVIEHRDVSIGRTDLSVRLLDRSGHALGGVSVVIMLSRPETSRYDRSYAAREIGGGLYTAAADLPLEGRWQLRTEATQGQQTIVFEGSINVTKER